jgi:hypothetical protein
VVNFSEKDDPKKLKIRSPNEYKKTMLIIDTSCVIQWPRNLTDETLIRGQLTSDDSNDEFSMMMRNEDKGI